MNNMIVYSCEENSELSHWKVVTDSVMGGKSDGQMSLDSQGACVFSGTVSLENNGGFSMVRYRKALGDWPDGTKQFKLKVKGDGRRYQFRVKSDLNQRHSYGMQFETTGEWQEVVIPFVKLLPVFRGNWLELPAYDGKNLEELAFLTGKEPGQFELKIASLTVD